MDIGLSLRHALQASPPQLRRLAQESEALGLHSLWVPHHTVIPLRYDSRYPYQVDERLPFPSDTIYGDGLSVLSHLAAVTESIRLGTNVLPMLTQHPVALAKQAATVDHLSSGRLELGIGGGWLFEEAVILGLPTDNRGKRLDEAIDIMRKAWTGRAFTHQGDYWDIPEVVSSPGAAQGADVPIWIGGGSPAAIRTMASRATGALVPPGPPGEQLLSKLRIALAPDKRLAIPVAVSGDAEPAIVLERFEALREAGASLVILYTDTDHDVALATVRLVAEHVLPQL